MRALLVLLAACTPVVIEPEPAPVAAPATPETACAALDRLGCPEARPVASVTCPDVIRLAERLTPMRVDCITAAESVEAVRACKTVRCRD